MNDEELPIINVNIYVFPKGQCVYLECSIFVSSVEQLFHPYCSMFLSRMSNIYVVPKGRCFCHECSMLSFYLRAMSTVTLANESQPRELLSRQSTKKYSFDFNCLYKTFYLAEFFTLYTLTVLVAPRSFLLDSLLREYYMLL